MAGLPVIFVDILALAVSMGGENLLQFFSIYLPFKRIRLEKMEKIHHFSALSVQRSAADLCGRIFGRLDHPKNKLRTIRPILRECTVF